MVMYSSQVAQQIYMQQMAAAQQMQNAHMIGMQAGTSPMGAINGGYGGMSGVFGEQVAGRMASAGQTGMGMAGMGLGIAGMFTGMPLDPFSAGITGARAGFGMAGIGGGILGAGAAMLPFYAASQAASVYGGAFHGGMQQQMQTNQVLRQNFNFQGGQGAYGRGFSQRQMGQVGSMISQEARQSPFTSSAEMNQLIAGGAESGMFTAVRDVQQFAQRFKTMLDGLRKIQKELGGTLSEALQFTRGTQQLGIFSTGTRTQFASEMRDSMSSTGMSQDQLFAVAAQGSMLSRATGGLGRQGALGALRVARGLGAAISSGAINQEALSEATGGLTGTDAIQAMSGRILQQSERFSRRAMGRYSLFALSNAEGTGLDAGELARFQTGDISVGGVMGAAHRNVNHMGRARALNREGMLRGSLMEEGGLSARIGMMRLAIGDRVMDQGDDRAQLIMQRRFGMDRNESELMSSLMRNQGSIAQHEMVDRGMSRRETSLRNDISANRSVDAFMEHLQHGLQDATGVTKVREIGRNFLTKISSMAERAMNDVLGVQASTLSSSDNLALQRVAMGMGTKDDVARLSVSKDAGAGAGTDAFAKPLAQEFLGAMGMHNQRSLGENMLARGTDLRGMSIQQRDTAIRLAMRAQKGHLAEGSADESQFNFLMENKSSTIRRMASAELVASLGGDPSNAYSGFNNVSANAVDAFRARNGMKGGAGITTDSLLDQGGGGIRGNLGGIAGRTLYGAGLGAAAGSFGGPLGTLFGGVVGGVGFGIMEAMRSAKDGGGEGAAEFVARGGHFGRMARGFGSALEMGVPGSALSKSMRAAGITEAEARAMKKFDTVDSKVMAAYMNSDGFQSSLRRLQERAGDPRAVSGEIETMRIEALSKSKGPEQDAALLAIKELEQNLRSKKDGGIGGIGAEFKINMNAREKEIKRHLEDSGRDLQELADNVGGDIGTALGKASGKFYDLDVAGGTEGLQGVQSTLADLDPNTQKYRDLAEKLSSTDSGKALLMGASRQRSFMRDVSGKGRRGPHQAAETALGALTGDSVGSMDLTIGGHLLNKRNQAQRVFEIFKKGGKNATDLEGQIAGQLNIKDSLDRVKEFSGLVKGGLEGEEAKKIYEKFSQDPELRAIREQGMENMQRARDPLGATRNDLLEKILNKLPTPKGREDPDLLQSHE